MKERRKRCFEKNSVLLFFVSFRSDQFRLSLLLLLFILLQQACEKYKILSKNNIFFSRVFFIINQIKKEREQKHLKRERERESAQQMRGKGGRALPLAISKGCLSSSSFEEE